MAVSNKFERLNTLYAAISDLDRVVSIEDDPQLLESVLNAVKDIPKSEYPPEHQDAIILAIRNSLLALYNEEMKAAGLRIGLEYQDPIKTCNDIQSIRDYTKDNNKVTDKLSVILERVSEDIDDKCKDSRD